MENIHNQEMHHHSMQIKQAELAAVGVAVLLMEHQRSSQERVVRDYSQENLPQAREVAMEHNLLVVEEEGMLDKVYQMLPIVVMIS